MQLQAAESELLRERDKRVAQEHRADDLRDKLRQEALVSKGGEQEMQLKAARAETYKHKYEEIIEGLRGISGEEMSEEMLVSKVGERIRRLEAMVERLQGEI